MADTTDKHALPYPEGIDFVKPAPAAIQALAEAIDAKMASYDQGLLANLPAAGVEGRRYFATDAIAEYLDTGNAWVRTGLEPGFGQALPVAPSEGTEFLYVVNSAGSAAPDAVWRLRYRAEAWNDEFPAPRWDLIGGSPLVNYEEPEYTCVTDAPDTLVVNNTALHLPKNGVYWVEWHARYFGLSAAGTGRMGVVRQQAAGGGAYDQIIQPSVLTTLGSALFPAHAAAQVDLTVGNGFQRQIALGLTRTSAGNVKAAGMRLAATPMFLLP